MFLSRCRLRRHRKANHRADKLIAGTDSRTCGKVDLERSITQTVAALSFFLSKH